MTVNESGSSATQTNFTQSLTTAGLNIITSYTNDFYTPGIFWSTSDNYSTKPKAGIYLKETSSGTYMYFGTSNNYGTGITNDAMVIDYTGNVGIGTTGPATPLHVKKSQNAGTYLTLNNPYPESGQYLGYSAGTGIKFTGYRDIDLNLEVARIESVYASGSVDNRAIKGDLRFYTSASWNNVTEKMRITYDGNVGIGTTGPGYKLDVNGTIRNTDNSFIGPVTPGYPYQSSLTWQSDNTGYYYGFGYQKTDGTNKKLQMWWIDTTLETNINSVLNVATPGHTFDGTAPNSGRTIGASIAASGTSYFNGGNVGIGTAGPGYKLEVNGQVKISDLTGTGGITVYHNAGVLGIQSSDIRLKENIVTIPNSLEKVLKLRGVNFKWKKDKEKRLVLGMIAQEVMNVIPEAVYSYKTDDGETYYGVYYAELTSLLTNAIKEQQQQFDTLKLKVDTQQKQIENLQKQIQELRKK
jgi:hypothetical protein